ncbi:MAG: adenylate/guanylate cyclase domain-containing protein [Alphaproteobacteria bacterium]
MLRYMHIQFHFVREVAEIGSDGRMDARGAVGNSLFGGLPPSVRESVLKRVHIEELALRQGDVLCRKGDGADCLWVVISGSIVIGDVARGEAVFGIRQEGDVVGEQGCLDEAGVRMASMVALTNARLARLDRVSLGSLSKEELEPFYRKLALHLSRKLGQASAARAASVGEEGDLILSVNRLLNPDGVEFVRRAAREVVHAEWREAVVWFSDLVGFGRMSENYEAEVVGSAIHTAMGLQCSVIAESNGYVDKFMGDGLMAYWYVRDQSEERAVVETVLDVARKVVRDFGEHVFDGLDDKIGVRVGINIGPVLRGDFGTSERIAFSLLGRTVNEAARLEQVKIDVAGRSLQAIRASRSFYSALGAESVGYDFVEHEIEAKEGRIKCYSI